MPTTAVGPREKIMNNMNFFLLRSWHYSRGGGKNKNDQIYSITSDSGKCSKKGEGRIDRIIRAGFSEKMTFLKSWIEIEIEILNWNLRENESMSSLDT